jgi:hypothetical protein
MEATMNQTTKAKRAEAAAAAEQQRKLEGMRSELQRLQRAPVDDNGRELFEIIRAAEQSPLTAAKCQRAVAYNCYLELSRYVMRREEMERKLKSLREDVEREIGRGTASNESLKYLVSYVQDASELREEQRRGAEELRFAEDALGVFIEVLHPAEMVKKARFARQHQIVQQRDGRWSLYGHGELLGERATEVEILELLQSLMAEHIADRTVAS